MCIYVLFLFPSGKFTCVPWADHSCVIVYSLSSLSLSLSLFLSLSVQSVCVLAVKHFDGVEADVCFVYSGMDGCLSELEP